MASSSLEPGFWQRAGSRACSVLLGLAGAVYLVGLVAGFQSLLDPLPAASAAVIALSLTCAAIGPWLPQHDVFRLLGWVLRRVRGPENVSAVQTAAILWGQGTSRRRAWWLLTAVLSLTAGATAVCSLAVMAGVERLYGWLLDRTLLTAGTLRLVELLAILAVVGPAWLAIGLTGGSLHAQFLNLEHPGRSRSLALGLLVGAAAGLRLSRELILPYGSASHAMLIGSAGLFLAAAICLLLALGGARDARDTERMPRFSPPESAERLHPLILSGLACWGLTVGLSGSVWARVAAFERAAGVCLESSFLATWLLWMAAGVAAAGLLAPLRRHSPRGCGVALWVAGATGLGVAGLLWLVRPDVALFARVWPAPLRLHALAIALVGLAGGFALPYAKRALMVHRGGQPITYAELVSMVLAGIGVGLYAGSLWLVPRLGVLTTQGLAGLGCMGMGAILVLYERPATGGTPWIRPGLVVGSFLGLLFLVTGWARGGFLSEPGPAGGFYDRFRSDRAMSPGDRHAGLASAASVGSSADRRIGALPKATETPDQILSLLSETYPRRRVCVIGGRAGSTGSWESAGYRYLEHWTHDGLACPEHPSSPGRDATAGSRTLRVVHGDRPALAAWRTWRGPFDLIVLWPVETGPIRNSSIWTAETFVALRRSLGPGGLLLVILPAADLDAASLSVVAAGFRVALRGWAVWRAHPSAELLEQVWLLGIQPPGSLPPTSAGGATWRRIGELAPTGTPFPLHSMQTPRLGIVMAEAGSAAQREASLRVLVGAGSRQVR